MAEGLHQAHADGPGAQRGALTSGPRDGTARTLLVSLLICLVCSVAVTAATVLLRPIRADHDRRVQRERLMEILGRQPELSALVADEVAADLEEWVVELASGSRAPQIDPAGFDPRRAAEDPAGGLDIAPDRDIARIRRRPRHQVVTVVRHAGAIHAFVLPVYGRGYASLIRGSVAVSADGHTILGLVIHEHGETPGIGTEITEPDWLRRWSGKRIVDDAGRVAIRVAVGEVASEPAPPDARFRVDAISGATRSSMGVGNMIRFWVGEDGFGAFLARARTGEYR